MTGGEPLMGLTSMCHVKAEPLMELTSMCYAKAEPLMGPTSMCYVEAGPARRFPDMHVHAEIGSEKSRYLTSGVSVGRQVWP